jgi:hypothetical protein
MKKNRGLKISRYCPFKGTVRQGCGAGTGRNRIHLGTPAPEPYSEYGSSTGSGYKEMKQKTQKNLLKV